MGSSWTADAACQTQAFRLPSMASEQPRHPPDCNRLVWSQDGSLVARCKGDFTSMTSSDGIRFPNVDGCAPAWRADGALSVILDGSIVIARRHGDPFIFFSRPQLTETLRAAGVENAVEWRFAQVGGSGSRASSRSWKNRRVKRRLRYRAGWARELPARAGRANRRSSRKPARELRLRTRPPGAGVRHGQQRWRSDRHSSCPRC